MDYAGHPLAQAHMAIDLAIIKFSCYTLFIYRSACVLSLPPLATMAIWPLSVSHVWPSLPLQPAKPLSHISVRSLHC